MEVYIFILTIISFITLLYGTIIMGFTIGWFRIKKFKIEPVISGIYVSVIIAARNEETHIGKCLHDLLNQDYDRAKTSIIIVNDRSADQTPDVVNEIIKSNPGRNISLLHVNIKDSVQSHKKEAIETAIKHTMAELIITTDADCRMGERWISSIVSYFNQYRPKMLLSPVIYDEGKNILQKIQALEFSSLLASTAGSSGLHLPVMANGANLAYYKADFEQLGGYHHSREFASGDDIFLLLRMKKVYGGNSIHFLKCRDALVSTSPPGSLKAFYHQRIRWTSKSRAYKDPAIIITALSVYLMNLGIVSSLLISCFIPEVWWVAVCLFLFKFVIDLPILIALNCFTGKQKLLVYYPLLQLFYFLYISVIGSLGNFVNFKWKS